MIWWHIVVLALIQGITEFIPVSSSAHLILLPKVTGWPDQGLIMDVAAHIGTLGAVLVYFRQELLLLWHQFWKLFYQPKEAKLLICVILASFPAVLVGLVAHEYIASAGVRSLVLIGWNCIIFGLLMFIADRLGALKHTVTTLTKRQALLIGFAQAFAILPGASRSGTTVTMARFLGFDRAEAFRFSFLLSIPAIAGAGVLSSVKAVRQGLDLITVPTVSTIVLSFLIGLLAIYGVMHLVKQTTLLPIIGYRVVLGVVLLLWGYGVIG